MTALNFFMVFFVAWSRGAGKGGRLRGARFPHGFFNSGMGAWNSAWFLFSLESWRQQRPPRVGAKFPHGFCWPGVGASDKAGGRGARNFRMGSFRPGMGAQKSRPLFLKPGVAAPEKAAVPAGPVLSMEVRKSLSPSGA